MRQRHDADREELAGPQAPLRMLMNNLDSMSPKTRTSWWSMAVLGRAARNWECYDAIVEGAEGNLESDETLLVQSGKPAGGRIQNP